MSKTRGDRAKHFPYGQVYRRRGFGDERILTLDELVTSDPVPSTETMPAELQRMLEPDPAVRYIESEEEPDVRVVRKAVGHGPNAKIWAVELESAAGALLHGRPGLDQTILKLDEHVGSERLPRYEASYRPPWARVEFLPRLAPRRESIGGIELLPEIGRNWPITPMMNLTSGGWYDGWPWTCIGKVEGGFDTDFNKVITTGTGVLVGRNILLTAAHLAIWGRDPGRWWMRFFPAFDDGPRPDLGMSYVEGFRGPGPQSNPNANDFVVCKLYTPLGDALGYLGYHWSSDDDFYYDQRWLSAGYPDYEYGGRRPVSMYNIEVRDIDNEDGDGREVEIKLNNYLLNGGWSGGPLWGWFPGNDPRVIGICSGYEADGWDPYRSVFAGGRPFVNHVSSARQGWF